MKAGGVRVREMTVDDLPAVMEIERASFPLPWSENMLRSQLGLFETVTNLVAVEKESVDQETASALKAGTERASAEAERIVGYASAWFGYLELHILSIAIIPDRRGSGAADLLLAAAIERGRARGCETAVLEVRSSNLRAQNFYRRHGFRLIGRRPRYYPDSGEEALVLEKRIAEAQ